VVYDLHNLLAMRMFDTSSLVCRAWLHPVPTVVNPALTPVCPLPQVLSQIMYAMYSSDRAVVQRCACALAHMASIPDLHAAFVERKGLDILVEMLTDGKRDTRDALQREAASAPSRDLYHIAACSHCDVHSV